MGPHRTPWSRCRCSPHGIRGCCSPGRPSGRARRGQQKLQHGAQPRAPVSSAITSRRAARPGELDAQGPAPAHRGRGSGTVVRAEGVRGRCTPVRRRGWGRSEVFRNIPLPIHEREVAPRPCLFDHKGRICRTLHEAERQEGAFSLCIPLHRHAYFRGRHEAAGDLGRAGKRHRGSRGAGACARAHQRRRRGGGGRSRERRVPGQEVQGAGQDGGPRPVRHHGCPWHRRAGDPKVHGTGVLAAVLSTAGGAGLEKAWRSRGLEALLHHHGHEPLL
mmetsp:Transcript_70232/g.209345  ORF Transcript_70232/g.209345 Transcript_70232/m.209345 type:complete len:275 (-) Transcript_70232:155-979(-)